MQTRTRLSLPVQLIFAVVGGAVCGVLFARFKEGSPSIKLLEQVFALAGFTALTWLRALAVPLVVSSAILGGVGLEPMRAMGKLVGKTLAWNVAASLLAVTVAVGVAGAAGPGVGGGTLGSTKEAAQNWPDTFYWEGGWLGLVLASLAFGYYRNQIDEGPGRMFIRFCQGMNEMLAPLLQRVQNASAWPVFFLVASVLAANLPYLSSLPWQGSSHYLSFYTKGLLILLSAAGAYLLAISAVVWFKVRVNPWRCLPAVLPAMLVAASGQSLEGALPLTMDALRHRIGVSNRVASVSAPLGAVLQRDGQALGWTVVALYLAGSGTGTAGWAGLFQTIFAAVFIGVGLGALSDRSGLAAYIFLGATGRIDGAVLPFVVIWVIASVGGAVSVFSQACVAIIIAREEGEFWVPGMPPTSEELQGLKNDLAAADN